MDGLCLSSFFSTFSPLIKPLGIVPSGPVTNGVTFTFIAILIIWQGLTTSISFSFLWFLLCGPPGCQSSLFGRFFIYFLFFWLIISWSCFLAEIGLAVCISKSQRTLCISFSRTDSGLSIYYLFIWSNFSFLHKYQCITFLTQSYLILYSFCCIP